MMYPAHSMFNEKYRLTLKNQFRFELVSFFGRHFMYKRPPVISAHHQLLNLGCGENCYEGWVNADFFPLRIKLWKKEINGPNWRLDFRYRLNCLSDYWDCVFCEHVLEHLTPMQSLNLLKEILRTLKPGCYLRISVPDLKKYVDYYHGREVNENFKKRWATGAEAIRSLTQNWGHNSVWDREILSNFLERAGFVDIVQRQFMDSSDERLKKDSSNRRWETLYVEAQKP